jgi:hypothetical protein
VSRRCSPRHRSSRGSRRWRPRFPGKRCGRSFDGCGC